MPALPPILSRLIDRVRPAPVKPELPAFEGPLRVLPARPVGEAQRTEPEVESAVRADFAALSGKVIFAEEVECYDNDGDSVSVACDPPAVVRILPSTPEDMVVRWMDDEHCDATYLVEVVEPHPAFADARPYWMYATTRTTKDGVDPGRFVVAPDAFQAWYAGRPAATEAEHQAAAEAVPAPAMR